MGQKGIILNTKEEGYIDAKDFASFLSAMNGSSGVLNYKENLRITRLNDNKVRIASGIYCLNGRMIQVDNYIDLAVESGTLGMNRIDLVVAEFIQNGKDEGTDVLHLRILKGTPSSNLPSAPALINSETIWHEKLYELKLSNTTLSLGTLQPKIIYGNSDGYTKTNVDELFVKKQNCTASVLNPQLLSRISATIPKCEVFEVEFFFANKGNLAAVYLELNSLNGTAHGVIQPLGGSGKISILGQRRGVNDWIIIWTFDSSNGSKTSSVSYKGQDYINTVSAHNGGSGNTFDRSAVIVKTY